MDKDGVTQTTTKGILYTFVVFLHSKYDLIHVDDACVTEMESAGHRTLSTGWRDLDMPISAEELKTAVCKELVTKHREEMASVWNF